MFAVPWLKSNLHDTVDNRFGPYFCSPVIAGLEESKDGTWKPYLCGMDTIGAIEKADDFMVAGTAPDSLSGMCESSFKPDMVSILPSYFPVISNSIHNCSMHGD